MNTQSIAARTGRAFRIFATVLSLGVVGISPLAAQGDAERAAQPVSSLFDLPPNVGFLGKPDPRIHRATAIVNGKVITDTDVEQRLALIILANGKMDERQVDAMRLQVLRNLIDETLEIQEAKVNNIVIDPAEIEENFARVAANFRQNPSTFTAFLRSKGSSPASIKRQIEGELAWSRLLRQKVQPFINVSEDEVKSIIQRMNSAKGSDEYRLGEIFLSATPENQAQIEANARSIIEQIRGGGSFSAFARQFSEASTASVGGDLGWVKPAQLPEELARTAAGLSIGQMAGPIPVSGGFSILVLVDKRQVMVADPRDSLLSLKQLSITFPPGTTKAQAAPRITAFNASLAKIQGCGTADEIGKSLNAEVVDNDNVRVRDLPAALQSMLISLQVGQVTPPFGSLNDGVRALVLCGRDDSQSTDQASFDRIMAQIQDERVNKRARSYLRDLRRDAVIDWN